MIDTFPSRLRIAAAFLLAPMAGALLVGAIWKVQNAAEGGNFTFSLLTAIACLGGYPAAWLFGAPIYFLLRRRIQPKVRWAILAGLILALIPVVVLIGAPIILNRGIWSVYNWRSLTETGLQAATAGALGGFVFWLVAYWRTDSAS